jgi:PAS domain S-box-containing protein
MKQATRKGHKLIPPQTATSPVPCSITSALKAPCCTILESISDGVFTIDLDKRVTSFNRAAEIITGFTGREAIGQYCFDVFRANICEKRCALDETLATGLPRVNLSALIISKSGVQKPISISTAILKSEKDDIIGGVETFRDLSELEALKRQLAQRYTHEDIVGRHPRIKEILSFLPDIAASDSTVLIEGPTGSGKELIARAIHSLSPSKGGPFIAVNCAALPESLLESELFGYRKGAFTGAAKDKPKKSHGPHHPPRPGQYGHLRAFTDRRAIQSSLSLLGLLSYWSPQVGKTATNLHESVPSNRSNSAGETTLSPFQASFGKCLIFPVTSISAPVARAASRKGSSLGSERFNGWTRAGE